MTAEQEKIKDLEKERKRLVRLRQDAADEKKFIVRQSGVHLSRSEWLRYDQEIEDYTEEIADIDRQIKELRTTNGSDNGDEE